MPNPSKQQDQEIQTFPTHKWAPRDTPTTTDIETSLSLARDWWWYASGGNSDDSISSFIDLFERYLGGEVRKRLENPHRSQTSISEW